MSTKTALDFLEQLEPSEVIHLYRGDFLFHIEDETRGIFLVRQGKVKLFRNTVDGHIAILYIAQTGESLAEASLFSKNYHCHAMADTPSEVFAYDKKLILDHLSSTPDSSLHFIEILARKVQGLRMLVELRGIQSPRTRLIQYIHLLADPLHTITLESTYKDLAIQLGMTHETLYRLLAQLEKEDAIFRKDNKITLKI